MAQSPEARHVFPGAAYGRLVGGRQAAYHPYSSGIQRAFIRYRERCTRLFRKERNPVMSRLAAFAVIGGLALAGATTANAMPLSPLSGAQIVDSGTDITVVQWGRQCWRDGWGRVH